MRVAYKRDYPTDLVYGDTEGPEESEEANMRTTLKQNLIEEFEEDDKNRACCASCKTVT